MYYPSEEEFYKIAKKDFIIPIYKKIRINNITPFLAYEKIKNNSHSYLLGSAKFH